VTAATAPPTEVAEYLAAVRTALADLPPSERDDLVVEVEPSLVEAAAEGGSLTARLGPPEEFAAELRAAAGFHESARREEHESRTVQRLRLLARGLADNPRGVAVMRVARELAPIWWVARAYFAVGAIAYAAGVEWSTRYPVVPRFGSAEMGVAVIVAATVVSVALGVHARRTGLRLPRVASVLNALLALAIVPTALAVTDTAGHDALVAAAYAPPPQALSSEGLWANGVRVENIYPYSRDGKLLHDVLLYDGAGRPIEIESDPMLDPYRRYVVTSGNERLFNVFPIRYYEPGTKRVERPNAAPYVDLPLVLTPPLPARRTP
jgi:uncharacterized membrane protein